MKRRVDDRHRRSTTGRAGRPTAPVARRASMAVLLGAAGAALLGPAAAFADGGAGGSGGASGSGGSGSSSASQVVGYNVTAEGIGAQFGFDIPGLIPLPNENLIEADLPFSRTLITSGPQVDAIGSPYYPGDILGNFGGLASEFFPPQFPNPGNWPVMARAQYPANPAYGASNSFGPTPPSGSPLVPGILSASAHASQGGGDATGNLSGLVVGPGMGPGGAAALEVATVQATNTVQVATSTITATANSVLKTIAIAGMVDITQITSNASSTSDGTTGSPTASLHLGQVTVAGQPAYIDDKGVHVVGTNPVPAGVPTPSDLQKTLDATLAQDGITIRLLDPQQTANGAEGTANSGGVLVSISHAFNVPFVNLGSLTGGTVQPCINTDLPPPINQSVLGTVCLPAGNYTAVTSVTLGLATTDVNASAIAPLNSTSDLTGGLGLGGSSSTLPLLGGQTTAGSLSGPGVTSTGSGRQAFGPRLLHFPIRGIPAPVGWVAIGAVLCVLFAYPMMLLARWQFLVGRR